MRTTRNSAFYQGEALLDTSVEDDRDAEKRAFLESAAEQLNPLQK
jgi:hypothetical protein